MMMMMMMMVMKVKVKRIAITQEKGKRKKSGQLNHVCKIIDATDRLVKWPFPSLSSFLIFLPVLHLSFSLSLSLLLYLAVVQRNLWQSLYFFTTHHYNSRLASLPSFLYYEESERTGRSTGKVKDSYNLPCNRSTWKSQ